MQLLNLLMLKAVKIIESVNKYLYRRMNYVRKKVKKLIIEVD